MSLCAIHNLLEPCFECQRQSDKPDTLALAEEIESHVLLNPIKEGSADGTIIFTHRQLLAMAAALRITVPECGTLEGDTPIDEIYKQIGEVAPASSLEAALYHADDCPTQALKRVLAAI